MSELQLDSGILQFIPKGAYYEGKDEQFARVKDTWDRLLAYDRVLFALLSLLNGSGFSKGMISHMLLSNPQTGNGLVKKDDSLPLPEGLDDDFEKNVILYNLHRIASEDSMPRAIKNLLILAGSDSNARRVNNARTRKIILEFIFNRDNRELDALAVNYKSKLAKLVRHALGKQDLYAITHGNKKLFQKLIGRYNRNALSVVNFLFGYPGPFKEAYSSDVKPYFPQIESYFALKQSAQSGDIKEFKKHMKKLPWRTVIGFRNTYKLDIDKSEIFGTSKMSDKDKMQTQSAQKRSGAKTVRKVNYDKQDLYDLWKLFYHKILNNDAEDIEKISDAIEVNDKKVQKMDFENVAVVVDFSHSMRGSDERPLHPMLTALCLLSCFNFNSIHPVGGKFVMIENSNIGATVASGASPLWRGLVDAVLTGAKTIVVISDGYENAVAGMFDHVYKHFKSSGYEFDLLQINPVFASDAKTGTVRSLVEGGNPMPVNNYKHLETEFIFRQMLDHTEMVKKLLLNRYQNLIGRNS
jgi:hypothetical protein